MKKLMYLFVVAIMFAFASCGGGESATEEAVVEEAVVTEDTTAVTEDDTTAVTEDDTTAVEEELEAIE